MLHAKTADEIWHAGDIGSEDVLNELEKIKPVRAVSGNIDGQKIRTRCPENLRFHLDGLDIWITHIAGYTGHYDRRIFSELKSNPPQLLVCGHSHILRVVRDPALKNMLLMNPGAAGRSGFHLVRTMLLFKIDSGKIQHVSAIELGKRTSE